MQSPALKLDRSLVINMKTAELSDSQIEDFFITMAICNTVVVSNAVESGLVRGRGNEGVTVEKVMALRYEAESPDEAALVEVNPPLPDLLRVCVCVCVNTTLCVHWYAHTITPECTCSSSVWCIRFCETALYILGRPPLV